MHPTKQVSALPFWDFWFDFLQVSTPPIPPQFLVHKPSEEAEDQLPRNSSQRRWQIFSWRLADTFLGDLQVLVAIYDGKTWYNIAIYDLYMTYVILYHDHPTNGTLIHVCGTSKGRCRLIFTAPGWKLIPRTPLISKFMEIGQMNHHDTRARDHETIGI